MGHNINQSNSNNSSNSISNNTQHTYSKGYKSILNNTTQENNHNENDTTILSEKNNQITLRKSTRPKQTPVWSKDYKMNIVKPELN